MTQNTQTTAERIKDYLERTVAWDNNHGDMEGYDEASQTIAAEIDAMTRERDEARGQVAGLDAGMRFQFDRAEDYKAQRDEARAEVERLRPAAEAWEAREHFRFVLHEYGNERGTFAGMEAAEKEADAAVARARAAKGSQP